MERVRKRGIAFLVLPTTLVDEPRDLYSNLHQQPCWLEMGYLKCFSILCLAVSWEDGRQTAARGSVN